MPKPSSGRRKKAAFQFGQAKTLEEANRLAVQYGLAEKADFRELDIRAANEIIETLKKTKDEFPNAFDKLEFLGGSTEYNRYKKELGASLGVRFENVKMGDATASYVTYYLDGKYYHSIIFNSKDYNSKNYSSHFEVYKKNVKERWHPVGCNTIKSTADHEIAHAIDRKFNISSRNRVIMNLYNQHHGSRMTSALSTYADTNIEEFIAEAWSEYRNNPYPRTVAKQVGNEIMKYLNPRQPFVKRVGNKIISFLKGE